VLLPVGQLPDEPLEAATVFLREELAEVAAAAAGGDLTLVFAPADHTHRGWRLAIVQELARKYAPRRINAVASDDEAAIAAAERYLAASPGVTGQLLPLDGNGAG
jgi:hypothetical protein